MTASECKMAYDLMFGPAKMDSSEISKLLGIPEGVICDMIWEERAVRRALKQRQKEKATA